MYRTVKYELLSLEAWLATAKRPDRGRLDRCKAETIRIRQTLLTDSVSLPDHTHVERYLRCHHVGVIQLINKTSGKTKLYGEITNSLLELLAEMEKNFTPYLDPQTEICCIHHQNFIRQCKEMVNWIHTTGIASLVNEKLQATCKNFFIQWSKAPVITYHQRMYAHRLMKEIQFAFAHHAGIELEEALNALTLTVEYNSTTAFEYWKSRISTRLNSSESKSEQREILWAVQREVRYAPDEINLNNHPQGLTVRDRILTYIAEELEAGESSRQQTSGNGALNSGNFRMRMELSVSQLACFIKALVDTRMIVNPNVSELLRFLAQTTMSKRSETISFDSLRAKYYNIESGTKEALRQKLQSLLKNLS